MSSSSSLTTWPTIAATTSALFGASKPNTVASCRPSFITLSSKALFDGWPNRDRFHLAWMLGITNLLLAPGQFGIDTSASIRDALALEITQEFDVCRRAPLDRTAERLCGGWLVPHGKMPG